MSEQKEGTPILAVEQESRSISRNNFVLESPGKYEGAEKNGPRGIHVS